MRALQKHIWRTLVAVLLLVALAAGGCQDPIEPDDIERPIVLTIEVENESGRPVDGASVSFGREGDLRPVGATIDGEVRLNDFPVEIAGEVFGVRIDPPPPTGGIQYASARRVSPFSGTRLATDPLFDTVFVGCRDSRIIYRLSGAAPAVPCNGSRSDTLSFNICIEDRPTDTLSTPLLSHECVGQVLDFNLPTVNTPGLELVAFDEDGAPLGTTFSVPANTGFRIAAIYSASDAISMELPPGQIRGTSAGGSFTENLLIILNADYCSRCACPQENIQLARTLDTVCVGGSRTFDINLDNVVNGGEEDCEWVFELTRDFGSNDLEVVSEMRPVPGGGTARPLRVRFSPSRVGVYNEVLTYRISTRNRVSGFTEQCGTLTITVQALGGQGICSIDTVNSSLFRRNNTTGLYELDTLYQCMNERQEFKRLCIRNVGSCPLEMDASVLVNSSLFTVDPARQTIPPGDTACFTVRFTPGVSDVYPNGAGTQPRVLFRDSLLLDGCVPTSLPLTGVPRLVCAEPSNFISPEYNKRDWNGTTWRIVIDINEDNSLRVGPNTSGDTSTVIYVKSITTQGGPPDGAVTGAHLVGGGCQVRFREVDNRNPLGTPICDLFETYRSPAWNPGSWACDIDIELGDVIVFYRNGFFGIMWVKKLSWREQNNVAIPQVEIDICYPFLEF